MLIMLIFVLLTLSSCITMTPEMVRALANHHSVKGNTDVADYYYLQAIRMEEDRLLRR